MSNSTLSRPTGPSVCVVKGKGKDVGPPRAAKCFLTPFLCHDLYVHANIDFVDAYNAFHMKEQGLTEILTYDRKHFSRIPWVHIGDL